LNSGKLICWLRDVTIGKNETWERLNRRERVGCYLTESLGALDFNFLDLVYNLGVSTLVDCFILVNTIQCFISLLVVCWRV